jgi:hypothetical protein
MVLLFGAKISNGVKLICFFKKHFSNFVVQMVPKRLYTASRENRESGENPGQYLLL